jgi:SAM-dependent methyltransferase
MISSSISLIAEIKKKPELSGVADAVVLNVLEKIIAKSRINISKLSAREQKLLVKDTRAELRNYSGAFHYSFKAREKLLKAGKIDELLKTHSSTYERLDFYPELKELVLSLGVKSILDLGCGLNPIALATREIKYFACDIKEDELSLVKEFFRMKGIDGQVFVCDLRSSSANLPKADLCLAFKLFDVLEKRGHKLAEKIIKSAKCKYFLISFSTKTLSGAPMRHPQRGWIERLLSRLGFSFKLIKSRNELFYLAEKAH